MSIAKNYLLNLSYQILVVILPLITSPYIARNLGSEVIGIYTYTNSIAVYFSLMAALGIGTYASRQIAYDKNKGINSVSKTFWSIFYLKLIISSGVIIAYFLLVIFGIKEYTDIYIAQSLVIFATLFDISWLFIGYEDFKKLVIRNFVVRIVSLIGLFALVKSPSDLLTYTIVINVPNLIANLALWAKANKYIKYIKVDKKDIKSHFKPSLRLFIPQLASQVYLLLDRVMLGSMSNYDQVGFYEMAQRI
ncbi:MAG: oligosaccharide flippase family protein, partial [Romboutsia sp.]|uniref:oligosaccharide flippase family protein n=1 Tax=Romboutsia sp. TaxID=1965302 RepID=UPI003F3568B3